MNMKNEIIIFLFIVFILILTIPIQPQINIEILSILPNFFKKIINAILQLLKYASH